MKRLYLLLIAALSMALVRSADALQIRPAGATPRFWEWTRSRYEAYPYPETREARAERERFDPVARWVLRGSPSGL